MQSHPSIEGEVWLGTPKSLKFLTIVIVSIVFGIFIFVITKDYSKTESVTGWLVPKEGTIRITTRGGGILESLSISQGDEVKAGEALAKLNLGSNILDGNVGESLEKDAKVELAAALESANVSRSMLLDEEANLAKEIRALKRELDSLSNAINNSRKKRALAELELSRTQNLHSQGFFTNAAVDTKKMAVLEAEQSTFAVEATKHAKERELSELIARQQSLPKKIAELGSSAIAQQASLRQKLTQVQAGAHETVVAPISGTVATVLVKSGQILSSGEVVAILIPSNSDLEAEFFVPSRAIGFIKVGQKVSFRFQAFPYQRYGTGQGLVASVSKTIIPASDISLLGRESKEPVFKITATLSRQYVNAYGEQIPLQSGMLIDASVLLERHSLFSILFDPILAVSKRN